MNAIYLCELIDDGYVGDPFTWEGNGTKKCLDRMLMNLSWRLNFNEVDIHHLPFFKSDHRPLLIKFEAHPTPNQHRRPFQFEAAWLTHDDFDRVLLTLGGLGLDISLCKIGINIPFGRFSKERNS